MVRSRGASPEFCASSSSSSSLRTSSWDPVPAMCLPLTLAGFRGSMVPCRQDRQHQSRALGQASCHATVARHKEDVSDLTVHERDAVRRDTASHATLRCAGRSKPMLTSGRRAESTRCRRTTRQPASLSFSNGSRHLRVVLNNASIRAPTSGEVRAVRSSRGSGLPVTGTPSPLSLSYSACASGDRSARVR